MLKRYAIRVRFTNNISNVADEYTVIGWAPDFETIKRLAQFNLRKDETIISIKEEPRMEVHK